MFRLRAHARQHVNVQYKCHHFKTLPETIKSLKAKANNSGKIDPHTACNWMTLIIIIDQGHSLWQIMPSLPK